jgi:hypothetical protein
MKNSISHKTTPPHTEHHDGLASVEPQRTPNALVRPLRVPWWYRWIRDWRVRMWLETTVWPPR